VKQRAPTLKDVPLVQRWEQALLNLDRIVLELKEYNPIIYDEHGVIMESGIDYDIPYEQINVGIHWYIKDFMDRLFKLRNETETIKQIVELHKEKILFGSMHG